MRLFATLWLAGMIGVISLWGMNLPIPESEVPQLPLWVIKLLSLIQPTLLLSVAVLIGVIFAPKVGLSSPLAEAVSSGSSITSAIQPQIVSGIVGGLISSILLMMVEFLTKPFLPAEFVSKAKALSSNTSFLTRILYGGITEELLLRWGMMTLLVWVAWRIFSHGQGEVAALYFIGAILLSSFLFGLGHLPLVILLGAQVTPLIVSYVIVGNSLFGLIAGYLYWSSGLEAAMIAHMLFHGVVVIASRFV